MFGSSPCAILVDVVYVRLLNLCHGHMFSKDAIDRWCTK